MKVTILVFALLSITLSLTTRREQHLKSQSHLLNEQLCKSKGGIVCGFAIKDCCSKGCQSKFLGINEVCTQNKFIDLNALGCQKVCQSKGGQLYTDKILADSKCCKKGSFANEKCPDTAQISLGQCDSDTITDKIVGLVKK